MKRDAIEVTIPVGLNVGWNKAIVFNTFAFSLFRTASDVLTFHILNGGNQPVQADISWTKLTVAKICGAGQMISYDIPLILGQFNNFVTFSYEIEA